MYLLTTAQYMAAAAFITVALTHLLVWSRHRAFFSHLFFSWTAVAAAGNAVTEAWMYRCETVAAFVPAFKCYVTCSGLWLIGLIWFVMTVFQIRANWCLWLAWVLTSLFLVAIVANMLMPFSLIYTDILSLRTITVPWDEEIVLANGTDTAWRFIADFAQIGLLVLVCAGVFEMSRCGDRWRAFLLGGSLIVFLIFFGIVVLLIDLGILEIPYLTTYGFLVVVLVTSNNLAVEVSKAATLSEEIVENERRWRTLLANLPALVVGLDRADRIEYVNAYFERFTGYQASEVLGQPLTDLLLPDQRLRLQELIQETMDESPVANKELMLHDKVGLLRTVLWTKVYLRNTEGKSVGWLGIGTDITEQRKREAELRKAVDDERSRIAGDLHDSVTQTLFSTAAIADALPEVWLRHPDKAHKGLEDLRQLTKGALAEMRTLLVELRPESLLKKGLSELLQQLGEAMVARTRIPIHVDVYCDRHIPDDVQIAMYRIAQEALNNVIKHSEANSADVRLQCKSDTLVLIIRDNGIGFESHNAKSGRLGLGIMRDRARSINADFRIESQPDLGTTIEVTWQHSPGEDGHGS